MARHRRAPDAPRAAYTHAKWHDWWRCKTCGAVVEDWGAHSAWHAQLGTGAGPEEPGEPGEGGPVSGMEELVARARAEGSAVAEAGIWRGALRQIGGMVAADWAAARGLARGTARPPRPRLGRE